MGAPGAVFHAPQLDHDLRLLQRVEDLSMANSQSAPACTSSSHDRALSGEFSPTSPGTGNLGNVKSALEESPTKIEVIAEVSKG
jgi:hypothetical protein